MVHVALITTTNEHEDLEHFIMRCDAFKSERQMMFNELYSKITPACFVYLKSLPTNVIFYVLMGMVIDVPPDELLSIRLTSVTHVNKMYDKRKKCVDIH